MHESPTALHIAEMKADLLSAFVRVGILAVLLATMGFSIADAGFHRGVAVDIGLYGLATATSVFLAWRQVYHPLLPFAFATFDIVLIVAHMRVLATLMGLGDDLVALPASALIFVVLIHASMRYQPALIVYMVVLFVASIGIASLLPAPEMSTAMAEHIARMATLGHRPMGQIFTIDVMPLVLVATAGAMLVLAGYRTRRFLMKSIDQAARTARLSRFFSPSVAADLSAVDSEEMTAGRRQSVAVLFVDIKGFTTMAETMEPETLGGMLSEFRARVTECVFRHGGTVDKFIGDAVMVVFGAPAEKSDDAKRAIECGLDILSAISEWSRQLEDRGDPGVAIGIGGHFGEAFVGVLGSGRLLEYTVIGDTVNVAERLERLSREVNSSFVVSQRLLDEGGTMNHATVSSMLGGQTLRGRTTTVEAAAIVRTWGSRTTSAESAAKEIV